MTGRQKEALTAIIKSEKDPLYPQDIAPVLGTTGQSIAIQAREDASKLGFPVRVIGKRTQIPRYSFLRYCCQTMGIKINTKEV